MTYDNWKLSTPESFDYEEGRCCYYCGEPITDLNDTGYCSKEHKIADYNDG